MNVTPINTVQSKKVRRNAKASKILLSSLSVFFSVFVVLFMGFSVTAMNTSCSSTNTYGSNDILNEELTTGHKVQNIVSSPFRFAGGLIIYPLKALLIDFPSSLYNSFAGELDEYAEKLRAGSQRDKEEALFFLAYAKDAEAWKLIVKAFEDSNPEIRKQAVLSLIKRKDAPEESVDFVRALFIDTNPAVQLAVIHAIGELGNKKDIANLQEIYKDSENADVFRSFALLSMSKLGVKEAETEALIILGQSKQHPVMYANALMCIGYNGMQSAEGTKMLRESALSQDERVCTAAITGLGVAGEFMYLESLLSSRKINETVKKKILVVLGEYGGETKIKVIQKYLALSKNDELRQYAVFGLAKARYKPIVSELIENLRLDSPEIKTNIRKQSTVWARLWSLSFLFELTGQNYGIDYQPWKDWWDSNKEDFLKSNDG